MGNNDINTLKNFGNEIYSNAKDNLTNIYDTIKKSDEMIEDMKQIINELASFSNEQTQMINSLNSKIALYEKEIENKTVQLKHAQAKEEEFNLIKMKGLNITVGVTEINEQKSALKQEREEFERVRKTFAEEKAAFEVNKKIIIREKEDAVEKNKKLEKDINEAIIDRDKAIKEKDNEFDKCLELKKQNSDIIKELNSKKIYIDLLKKEIKELEEKIKETQKEGDKEKLDENNCDNDNSNIEIKQDIKSNSENKQEGHPVSKGGPDKKTKNYPQGVEK